MRGRGAHAAPLARPIGANDDIRLAIIGMGRTDGPGVGGRGHQLINLFRKVPNARIVALCDVDQQMLDRELKRFAGWKQRVKPYRDLRAVFDAPDIDAVVVATPNHWHALATVWACQAGKDVYVEKPASHEIWEGRQMVAAARKYKRIVQVGTQSRSSDICQQAVQYIQSGKLGKILYARAVIYRRRTSIGKATGPLAVPPTVNYDLWLGPAPKPGLKRLEFHYDWHWQWPTGNGEIGNNGVHYLDRCRWILGQNKLPHRAMSIGGRFKFDDDGQTPNTEVALLDYDPAPIICEIRGLPEKTGSKTMDKFRSVPVGIIVQCEGGAYISTRQASSVFDNKGKLITTFTDRRPANEQPMAHQANFVGAVRSRDRGDLNAEVLDGHLSTSLCHMANVSYLLGAPAPTGAIMAAVADNARLADALQRMQHHLKANDVDLNKTPAVVGPWVTMGADSARFVSEHAERANALSHRKYRKPFVVPAIE